MDVTSPAHAPLGDQSELARTAKSAWLLAGAAAGACAVVAALDPTRHALGLPCPFRVLTGWWCPFCGGTRALGQLVRGDVVSAARYNLWFVALLPVFVALWASYAFPGARWLEPLRTRWARPVWISVTILAMVFVVVRNIPVEPLTNLRFPGQ